MRQPSAVILPTSRSIVLAACALLCSTGSSFGQPAGEPADPLERWRHGVTIRPVSAAAARHTIHSYYVCCPESPDGSRVLIYTSTDSDGGSGNLCVLDRATGTETVVARQIHVEDAHRAACQQWVSGGKRVAFHDVRDGRWLVAVVDLDSGQERVLVRDRQLAFGQPAGDVLPIYGCHWNPGEHRDLELVDVETGAVRTAVSADSVRKTYGDWMAREFGDKSTSIFFPVLSPDGTRVFFKMAAGNGGDNFRTSAASHRQGLIGYDLRSDRLLFMRSKWGHPAWHPDSRRIIEVGNLLINSDGGAVGRIPNVPSLRGCHPSVSPDGRLIVMDGLAESVGGKPGEWAVLVADIRGGSHQVLYCFDNSQGARSWRRSHPHPVFSADGRRIYFNVSAGPWTQLHVAEAAGSSR
jgi:Tol biopolymer transport system component